MAFGVGRRKQDGVKERWSPGEKSQQPKEDLRARGMDGSRRTRMPKHLLGLSSEW